MMLIDNTPDNAAWATAVRARVNADARLVNAKSALWRLGGYGLLAIGLGVASGAAMYGYSFIADKQAAADAAANITKDFLAALDKIVLKTDGTVKLAEGSQVDLKPGGEVSLKPSTVGIDPNSTVRVEGRIETDSRPSQAQLAPEARPALNAKTDSVVFKHVSYGKGNVVTGWRYQDSQQEQPSEQYCYYSQQLGKSAEAVVWLGYDGQFKSPQSPPPNLDVKAAYSNCMWR